MPITLSGRDIKVEIEILAHSICVSLLLMSMTAASWLLQESCLKRGINSNSSNHRVVSECKDTMGKSSLAKFH